MPMPIPMPGCCIIPGCCIPIPIPIPPICWGGDVWTGAPPCAYNESRSTTGLGCSGAPNGLEPKGFTLGGPCAPPCACAAPGGAIGAAAAALVPKGSKSTLVGEDAAATGGETLNAFWGAAAVGEGVACAALPPVNPAPPFVKSELPPVKPALPPVKPALPPVNPALPLAPNASPPPNASKVLAAAAGACCCGLGVLRLMPPRRSDMGSTTGAC